MMFAICSTTVGWYASFFFAGGFINLEQLRQLIVIEINGL